MLSIKIKNGFVLLNLYNDVQMHRRSGSVHHRHYKVYCRWL